MTLKGLQNQVRDRVLETQQQSPERLPVWLRRLVRRVTGDSWTATFVRRIMWRYRLFWSLALMANLGSAVTEGATMAVLTLAINEMAASFTGMAAPAPSGLTATIMDPIRSVGGENTFALLLALAVLLQLAMPSKSARP